MTTWVDGTSTSRAASLLERKARIPGVIYAADYGVLADGSTDDATALNNALVAAAAGVSGGLGNTLYLPPGVIKVGAQIIVQNKVRVIGAGKRATLITAISGTFPTNTPVVRLGAVADAVAFGQRLEHLAVDCQNIANSTGVYSRNSNEGSGCFHVLIGSCNKYGFHFDQCSIISCMDIEVVGGTGTIAGFYAVGCAGQNFIDGMTSIPQGSATDYGVLIETSQFALRDIHAEDCTNGVHVTNGTASIDDVQGGPAVTNLVHLNSTTTCTVSNVYSNGSTHLLVDDNNSLTIDGNSLVFYSQNEVRIGKTFMQSGTAAPGSGAHVVGEIVWNNTPTAGGGASPFMGWTCVTAGTPGTWKTFGAISV